MKSRGMRLGTLALAAWLLPLAPAWAQEKRATLGFEVPGEKSAPTLPRDLPKDEAPAAAVMPRSMLGLPNICDPDSKPFWGRLTLRTDVGDGVGYTRGFTTFEAMIPLDQDSRSLWFSDVRLLNFDQENRWEYNLGAGYRWYSERSACVFGVNAFYDARKTDYHFYEQLGLGFEALTPTVEFRVNGYWIVGQAHRLVGDSGFNNIGIAANNFIFVRQQIIETAMGGVEVEAGGRLPFLDRFCPRLYAGFYSYSAANQQTANGVRGRFEAQLTERITLHASVQNDAVFRTTASGGLAISFGAPAYRCSCGRPSWEDVLRQPVHRDVNIVVHQNTNTVTAAQPVPPPPPPPIEDSGS